MSSITIKCLNLDEFERAIPALAKILLACVKQGASIGFIEPFDYLASCNFWQNNIKSKVDTQALLPIVALENEQIIGCVLLDTALPDNQSHRADVAKLLVDPSFQRRGVARKLMLFLEEKARVLEKSLLVLDTKTDDNALHLYLSLDYKISGIIPCFAREVACDTLVSTSVMYKLLTPK